jgi:hypothetical protein
MTTTCRSIRGAVFAAVFLSCLVAEAGDARAQPVSARDFDDRITSEVTGIAKVWSLSPRIEFADDALLAARPDGSIQISRGPLQAVLERAGPKAQADSLRWLLAHEMWHLVQFRKIGSDLFNRSDEYRRVIECQADVMAGHYLFNTISANFMEKTDALTAVGNIPQSVALISHGPRTHPAETDRRVAIQFGMSRAFYDHVGQIVGAEHAQEVKDNIARLMNFAPGDPVDEWALTQCKKITHYDKSNAFLERGKTDISWNKNGDPPTVDFNITYRNIGDKTLRVSLEVLSASIPRDARAERARWQRQQTFNQTVEIAPRATHTVSGTLYWYADDDLMPRLVYPLEEGSLVSVEEIGAPVVRTADTLPPVEGISAEAAKLGASLLRIASEAPANFAGIRAAGCTSVTDTRICPSSAAVPGSAKTEVWVERNGSATVEVELRYKVAKPEAQGVYDGFAKNLKALWPTRKMKERISKRSGLPSLEFQLTDRADISLDMTGSDDKYSVSMTITPVN